MIKELLNMYESGAITGYQVMMACLHMLDPKHPDLTLSELPGDILDEILEYARRYDPSRPRSTTFIPPAEDQVRAAERWICDRRVEGVNPALGRD
jgi:hypothetical protein